MSEDKKGDIDKIMIGTDEIKKYFPRSFTPRQMRDTIFKLFDAWVKKRQKKNER